MTAVLAPWQNNLEPNQGNIKQYLDNLYSKFQPIEQSRWTQSNIDTLFYAGAQSGINRYYNTNNTSNQSDQYYFNICQQPVNMITGYQRQHRKAVVYMPTEGSDPTTTDQYTRVIVDQFNKNGIHEQFSKACELAAISGMVMLQPYLDFGGDDAAQGELKLKIWEYNSFLVDPYFRNPDMSDCQYVWCQEYISKQEAESRFPGKLEMIAPMSGTPQRYGNFYFLPENYNMARNDLMVLSYVWYKWKTKKKRLYSKSRNQFFDLSQQAETDAILYNIPDMELVTVDVDSWKLAVVLNDQLMFQGENPLGFSNCPFIPVFWNYEPHNNYYDLRVRSLIRTMRSPQFLFNHKVITNNDIASATINAGWKRKVGAVANEDNLKKSGQGYDVLINEGYELSDCEKILPSAVPESDLALAQQMMDLMFKTSGIDLENWSGQTDKQISSLTAVIKQAANLMVFQKYFDQWDYSLKLLGDLSLQVVLNNWNAEKVKLIIGEEPSEYFYSKIFAKYKIVVEEGLLTPTQKNYQSQQMLEINQTFGREVFPPSMIIKDMNLQGKSEMMEFLKQQEEAASNMQQEQSQVQYAVEHAQLQKIMSESAANIGTAKERMARSESNQGLFEERLSMIARNRAISTREKMDALTKLLEAVQKFGELEAMLGVQQIQAYDQTQMLTEQQEKGEAKLTNAGNEFLLKLLGRQGGQSQMGAQPEQMPQPQMSGMGV
jgi:GTP-sensing pleiotropic transcriptional regulator CodY